MKTQPMIVLHGTGTALNNPKAVERRAKCKLISQKTMLSLIDVANEKGAKDRVKGYWRTYHCQSRIITAHGRMYAPQCKNRFCTYCCGIRKAELIRKYLPVINGWEQPFFVTLTVKAVPAKQIRATIEKMYRWFRLILNRNRKRHQRGQEEKLLGLRTLECNFKPSTRTYNPHFHLLVPDEATADYLIHEWLRQWGKPFTHRDAQHKRKVEDREKDLVEVIKYEAKIFTEPDGKKSRGKKGTAKIYARALHNIYTAMKGFRLVDRFGFNLPKESRREKGESQLMDDYCKWEYDPKSIDWLTEEHESTLTAYTPPELIELLESNIDTELE